MHPLAKSARIAGAIYLSMVVTGPFSLIYVPNKLILRGNATARAANILAHETMFRLAILVALDYYGAAFRWAQPILFGELAIMLWLLIKGAKVPLESNTILPAAA